MAIVIGIIMAIVIGILIAIVIVVIVNEGKSKHVDHLNGA